MDVTPIVVALIGASGVVGAAWFNSRKATPTTPTTSREAEKPIQERAARSLVSNVPVEASSQVRVVHRPRVATHPTMIEIADAILAAKPYDRTLIPKNYEGIQVCWPVVFAGIAKGPNGRWCATFDSPDAQYRSVCILIDLDKYPQLKVLDWGHPAWIEGRILSADVRSVWLEDDAQISTE
jgi:hypothetical protein